MPEHPYFGYNIGNKSIYCNKKYDFSCYYWWICRDGVKNTNHTFLWDTLQMYNLDGISLTYNLLGIIKNQRSSKSIIYNSHYKL